MSVKSVIERVKSRLEQDERGDRGWFVITRVHVDSYWLKGIADYLFQKGGFGPIELTDLDYTNIAKIAEVESPNPGQQLRRHHLLVMDKPLRLIKRTRPPRWDEVQLTTFGKRLTENDYFSPVLDMALRSIRFAHATSIPAERVAAYEQFDVDVYGVLTRILKACDGYIDRDEFNFFVSRVRSKEEVVWAIEGIRDYRQTMSILGDVDQKGLLRNLNDFVHVGLSQKEYQNWRDVALHTFSLFDVGETMLRDGRKLWLTSAWAEAGELPGQIAEIEVPLEEAVRPRKRRALKIPTPPRDDELLSPPMAAPQMNSGVEAENLVAKILISQGWRVVFYSNKRGYGFDLWCSKDRVAMVIEVKSSTGQVGQINLTPTEYEAARHHGANFIIAVVEQAHSPEPQVWFVTDPANQIEIREETEMSYQITREAWSGVAQKVF